MDTSRRDNRTGYHGSRRIIHGRTKAQDTNADTIAGVNVDSNADTNAGVNVDSNADTNVDVNVVSNSSHLPHSIDPHKVLKSKEEIENEFKFLVFLHQHEEKNNDETIFTETYLNGSFKDTYIIREIDETFIPFEHTTVIVNNLSELWNFYESHKNESNILIDSRMVNYIAYATIKYGEDLLIYDAYTGKIKSIYFFCSDHFHIQTNELTISQIKQLFFMHLLILVYAKQLNINWNINNLIKCIKSNDYHIHFEKDPNVNIFDMIINYIKIQSHTDVNSSNVMKILNHFDGTFSRKAYMPESSPELKEWDLTNISGYEFFVAITILKNNNFRVL